MLGGIITFEGMSNMIRPALNKGLILLSSESNILKIDCDSKQTIINIRIFVFYEINCVMIQDKENRKPGSGLKNLINLYRFLKLFKCIYALGMSFLLV